MKMLGSIIRACSFKYFVRTIFEELDNGRFDAFSGALMAGLLFLGAFAAILFFGFVTFLVNDADVLRLQWRWILDLCLL